MNTLLAVLLALPAIVMYHRVDVAAPSDRISQKLTVSPAQFADELRDLQRMGLHTIGIDDLVHDVMLHHAPDPHAVLLTFDDGYSDQYSYAFRILRQFGDRATFFVNVGSIGTPRHLTWPDVDEMSRAGMSIECHGVSHADLASLSTAAQNYQIDGCVQTLRARLRSAVLAYAYPSGAFDEQTILLERRAGLVLGFTTDPRLQRDPFSPYEISRIRVVNGMSDAFFGLLLERTRSYVDVESAKAEPSAKP